MLKRTPPEVLQEQEQETGFRRVMRTFDPEVPGLRFLADHVRGGCDLPATSAPRLLVARAAFDRVTVQDDGPPHSPAGYHRWMPTQVSLDPRWTSVT